MDSNRNQPNRFNSNRGIKKQCAEGDKQKVQPTEIKGVIRGDATNCLNHGAGPSNINYGDGPSNPNYAASPGKKNGIGQKDIMKILSGQAKLMNGLNYIIKNISNLEKNIQELRHQNETEMELLEDNIQNKDQLEEIMGEIGIVEVDEPPSQVIKIEDDEDDFGSVNTDLLDFCQSE